MSRVFLVRHGRTVWNQQGLFRGRADPELDEVGRRQAEALGRCPLLLRAPIEAVYASPLRRARQTAEPLARRLGLEVRPHAGFVDMSFGRWEGRSVEEVRREWGELLRRWWREPHLVRPPGGEALQEVAERALRALQEVAERHEMAVVVAHQVVNRVLICRALGLGLAGYWSFGQEPACVNELEWTGGRLRLVSLNDRCHLLELGEEAVACGRV